MAKITTGMIQQAYEEAKLVYVGQKNQTDAQNDLEDYGLNRNSAGDLIVNFRCMMDGQKFTRTNNAETTKYYLDNILHDYGRSKLLNALYALEQHIEYYEDSQNTTMHKIRDILEDFQNSKDEEYPQYIVIQPIGKNNTIKNFLKDNSTRWAEKIRYKKQWKQSVNSIVLFIKDGKVFAKGDITKIKESKDNKYPLDFYYNLTLVDNINYKMIIEYAKPKLGNFRTYELLDFKTSSKIIKYINSQKLMYLDEDNADIELQKTINKITSFKPEEEPQKIKDSKEVKGNKIFPRNLAYAKFALEKAHYLCEIDNKHKTFTSNSSKKQFVEAHHLIPLKVQDEFIYSIDIPANIISLCPNCHRKIHFASSEDKNIMLEELLHKRQDDLKMYGIKVSKNNLFNIYA